MLVRGRISHTCLQLLGSTRSYLHGLLCYQQEWFHKSCKCYWQPYCKSLQRAKCKEVTPQKDGPWKRHFWSVVTMAAVRSSSLASFLANPPGLWGCYAVSPVPLGSSPKEISPESSQWQPGIQDHCFLSRMVTIPSEQELLGLADHHGVDEPTGGALAGKSFYHLGGPGEDRGRGGSPAYLWR